MNTPSPVPDLPGSKNWKVHIKKIDTVDIQKMVNDIHRIQTLVGDNGVKPSHNAGPLVQRGFHAKGLGLAARFRIREDVPLNLRVGLFAEGGRSYNAIARFSNAISVNRNDLKFDQRGLAIRIFLDKASTNGNVQDFLMTNTPVSFGKDARQFLDISTFLVESEKTALFKIIFKFPGEFMRIIRQALTGVSSGSYLTESFWSRTPFQIGDYAMKYMVQPTMDVETGGPVARLARALKNAVKWGRQNYLREDLNMRLKDAGQPLRFTFNVQLYQNERTTPIENAAREWKETDAPFAPVAELEIETPNEEEQSKLDQEIEKMAFSPWNTQDFKPLGTMNEARRLVYDQSAEKRGGCPLHMGR
jgi:catalase